MARLVAVAAVAALTLLDPSATAAAAPSAWPSWGSDTGHSYWNSAEQTVTAARVTTLKLNFTIPSAPDPDPGNDCLLPVAPVEAAGRLFDVGPDGISAYNQWSGARLWNAPPPAYSNGLLNQYVTGLQVVGSELIIAATDCVSASNSHAHVVILSTTTGAQLAPEWFTDGGSIGGTTIADGVMVGDETNNTEDFVVGTDLAGRDLWRLSGWTFGGVVDAQLGLAFLQDGTGVLTAVNISDGASVWADPGEGNVRPVALSQDGKDLYLVTRGGALLSVDPQTGLQRMKPIAARGGPIAVTSTTVFSNCNAQTKLCATRRSDGKQLWAVTTKGQCQPIVAAAVVYCAGRAYRASTGARIVSHGLDGVVVSSVAGGRVYALVGSAIESFK